ncbi:MAG: UDP-N-acetylglucosamine--N-acetylmuramyl-(pentapeptide) pyrophosphoryl-undecaprenol N-acetylglucosamine transferase [bacterium]
MGRFLIIISGIGTGGHYFPAVVVAREFAKSNYETIFLVRHGFPEEEIAKKYQLKTFAINPKPYYGKSFIIKIMALLKVVQSVLRLNTITKNCIGISFGGFGSLPLIISCMINRRPFYLFEPNRIPGRTTKLFSRRARKIFLGMPCGVEIKGNTMVTGIPVREEFKINRRIKSDRKTKTILISGGSQGAKKLNELAIKLQKILPYDYSMIIISGKRDFAWVSREKDNRTEVIPFTTEPWKLIAEADIVISRAGALSGYELLIMQKPVLFVPFPYAVDNHQYYNALYFTQMPNVKMELEQNLNETLLFEKIMGLINANEIARSTTQQVITNAEKIIVKTVITESI